MAAIGAPGADDLRIARGFARQCVYTPSPPEAIAKTYKLTAMELRVLLAIVEVGGVPEVAEALGIAETTVRTHLRQPYQKTGVDRQADLGETSRRIFQSTGQIGPAIFLRPHPSNR
jgi:DNA-binding NarL/FixJ family response regulator